MSEKLPEYVFHQFGYLFDKMDGAYFGEAEIAGILYGAKQDGTYPGADYVYRYIQCLQIRLREEKERTLHEKYKRCLALANNCKESLRLMRTYEVTDDYWNLEPGHDAEYFCKKGDFYSKWRKRWLKLAEQFKEAKCR